MSLKKFIRNHDLFVVVTATLVGVAALVALWAIPIVSWWWGWWGPDELTSFQAITLAGWPVFLFLAILLTAGLIYAWRRWGKRALVPLGGLVFVAILTWVFGPIAIAGLTGLFLLIAATYLIWWWRKPATQEDWRRWCEDHEDRWWFRAAQRRKAILAAIAFSGSLVFAWLNRPWGLLAVIAVGYTILWSKSQVVPGENFGSGIPDGDIFRDPDRDHRPVRCRLVWTGFIPLGIAWSPIGAIPSLIWLGLTIGGLATVTEIAVKVINFTIFDISPWLLVGGITGIYWLRWAVGPWRRYGFFLSRHGMIYQCRPAKRPFWRPLETEVATIAIGRVAHWSGSRGPFGGYTWDPGFELVSPAGASERVAGRFVPGWFIQTCERLASRF